MPVSYDRDDGDDSDGRSRSRRDVLRGSATAIAAGVSAGTSGCLATLPPLGTRVKFGRVDAPSAAPATYGKWIPDEREIDAETGFSAQGLMYATPANLGADELGVDLPFPGTFMKPQLDYFGHGFESFEEAVKFENVYALVGDVDRTLVAETVTESGYSTGETYNGYDAYTRGGYRPRSVLVGDDVVAFGRGEHGMASARAVLDARDGRTPRLVDTSETYNTVLDAVGASPHLWLTEPTEYTPSSFYPETWNSMAARFDESAAYFVLTAVFDDGATPSKGEIQDELEKQDRAVLSDATQVTVDGRVVTVEMRMPKGHFQEKVDVTPTEWPQVTWGVDRGDEQVTVTHQAGTPVDAGMLRFAYFGSDETPTPEYASGTITPGDTITFDVTDLPDSAQSISVRYGKPAGETWTTILWISVDENA